MLITSWWRGSELELGGVAVLRYLPFSDVVLNGVGKRKAVQSYLSNGWGERCFFIYLIICKFKSSTSPYVLY